MPRLVPVALFLALLGAPALAHAEFPVIDADAVRARTSARPRSLLVDVRSPEEYAQAHIAGAINIPAQNVKDEARRLPKDHKAPIIFYCRGMG